MFNDSAVCCFEVRSFFGGGRRLASAVRIPARVARSDLASLPHSHPRLSLWSGEPRGPSHRVARELAAPWPAQLAPRGLTSVLFRPALDLQASARASGMPSPRPLPGAVLCTKAWEPPYVGNSGIKIPHFLPPNYIVNYNVITM